ncbi:DNA replication complex GINS protein PSF3-like [Tropilaelaps mercedesae]|uniref:DNA replication complex GINS protein PSF3 n=1 Tax=Tropilaelaps mercedesae TaxID=418985 RepID=A0A1V9XK28_9ACAR|nr:DNA replication complex GINS protein PSF3-like [Tropilaelaps mercedesae]
MYRSISQSNQSGNFDDTRQQRIARSTCEFEDYFDIDEILMLSERIPVVASKHISRLGFLDPTTDSVDLRKGTRLELPLWLAKNLYNMYSVDIKLPRAFSRFYVNIMRADSSCVDLKRLQPNYYKVGRQLRVMLPAEAQQISELLVTTFKGRFRKIADGAQNAQIEETDRVTAMFDNEERVMFLEGQNVILDLKRWHDKTRRNKIYTADLVVNHRKRKWEANCSEDCNRTSEKIDTEHIFNISG